MVVTASDEVTYYDLGALIFPIDGDWWRIVTTPFLHDNLGYAFIALTATGIFGMHLERRFGHVVPGPDLRRAPARRARRSATPRTSCPPSARTAPRSACCARGSSTTAWRRGGATTARTTCSACT